MTLLEHQWIIIWFIEETSLSVAVRLPVRVFRLLPGVNLENFDFTPDLVTEVGQVSTNYELSSYELIITSWQSALKLSHFLLMQGVMGAESIRY